MGFYHPAILSRKHRYNYMQKDDLSQDGKKQKTCPPNVPEIAVFMWKNMLIILPVMWIIYEIPADDAYFRMISYPQSSFSSV